jgi:CDP-diacylglycerol--glycerol-3-phosphate 3-phosphatidyltransferase
VKGFLLGEKIWVVIARIVCPFDHHHYDYVRNDQTVFLGRASLCMNLPNIITLSRIPMMFLIVGLMYAEFWGAPTIAFWLFIAAAVGDWLDGYLARRQNLVSNFGKFMDALTDKILILGLMVAFVEKEAHQNNAALFLTMVLITLCREFLVSGMRMVAATKGVVVAAERGGKAKTLMQLIAVGILLFVPMLEDDWARYVPMDVSPFTERLHQIGLAIFIGATALTVSSGVSYVLKYRRVFADSQK